ncbi:MAG: hypothetical protein SNJ73_02090 [Acetobacteraceae bacterium]
MRLVVRLAASLLLLLAAALLARDAAPWVAGHGWSPTPVGQVWFDVDAASLNMLQAGIQRRVSPALWEDVIQPVLTWPAAAVSGALGLGLWLGSRRRRA